MASSPITSWKIDGETMETVTDFTFGGSKITSDGDCNHEIKRCFAPWKESYDQPRQHIKNQKHYFADKSLSSQRYSFESWTMPSAHLGQTSSWRWVQAASFKRWITNATEGPNHLPSSRTHDVTLLRRTWAFKLFSLCFPNVKLTLLAVRWKKQECSAFIF